MAAAENTANRQAGPAVVDLTSDQLALIRAILSDAGVGESHAPLLFGSRVQGRARRYSDVDIGFAGTPLSATRLRDLREAFEESMLPFSVDVLNLSEASDTLRAHALATAVPFADAIGVSP